MDYVTFGSTGLRVSRLSFGTGTHGWAGRSEQTDLGLEALANLLREAHDLGVTFWDVADGYGSHPHVARALRDVPRDAVVIATKTTSKRARKVTRDVHRFLRELHTDVLDIVLLHCMSDARWPERYAGAMDALSRAKAEGKVRAVGVSCHSLGALRAAATSSWVDGVLARINHAGTNMDGAPAQVTPVLEQLYEAGKGVYGMKVLGCGRLAHTSEDVRTAMAYVLGLGTVHALTLGISSPAELRENVRLMEDLTPQHPLQAREP